jgi:hypothetical protein
MMRGFFSHATRWAALASVMVATGGVWAADRGDWADVPAVNMAGDLKIFWNVLDGTANENSKIAHTKGFLPVTLVDPYANRVGNTKEQLYPFTSKTNNNPWVKPPDFERIIRQDINAAKAVGLYVNENEILFDVDARKAWNTPAIRALSGTANFADFEAAYYREWASWWWLPLKWARETYPTAVHTLYGRQPFQRDYWGIVNKTSAEREAAHQLDMRMWGHIDPYVDAYVVDIYNFYDKPDSVFYMASNVELNLERTRTLGNKPIYVYEWLRYHDSNVFERNREVDPYLVEAMAAVPYFSGAKGIVLWGHEMKRKPGAGHGYQHLALYMTTLARVASLSDKISRGRLIIDTPADVLWKARKPLVRRVELAGAGGRPECVVLAINPWQSDTATSTTEVMCGVTSVKLTMAGRHTTLAHIVDGKLTLQ